MQVTRRSKLFIRLQNYAFTGMFLIAIGMLAWLSTRYVVQADWTAGGRNTLSEDSQRLLDKLSGPVTITAYARQEEGVRRLIEDMVARYQRYKPEVQLLYVNPDAEPDRVRQEGITMDGELVISYQGRSEHVKKITEQTLSNALLRIASQQDRWIAFVTGHGERSPTGQANYDLGTFGEALKRKGLKTQSLNLSQSPTIPANTQVLVIASPQVDFLLGELMVIKNFIDEGGNVLWMTEPGESNGLGLLAENIGLEFLPGVVVDATTQLFGIQSPDFAVIVDYSPHAITREMDVLTLYPRAMAMEWHDNPDWDGQALLTTLERAWTETGAIVDEVSYDEGSDERAGPLDIAFALTRQQETEDIDGTTESVEQRLLVIGDGDFISNTYIGNGANLDMGLNMIHWLSHDDSFIAIRPKAAPDQSLNLSSTFQGLIGFGFLLILPAMLLLTGLTIWMRRRKR